MHKVNIRAFTLVELIVVITILGVLSTVGFVSYSGYLTGARDSNRVSQLNKMLDSLHVYSATKKLPTPDNYVEIAANGEIIAYQGELGVDVLEAIEYTNGGRDPKDNSYYTYYLTKDRKNVQLMAFMEEASSISGITETYAVNYSERIPKVFGNKLGILTQGDTNTPVQQLSQFNSAPFDVVTETGDFIAHISDDEKLEGAGDILQESIPNGSCKRIKQSGSGRESALYTINPGGDGDIRVHCDMEVSGGGWTLVARSVNGGSGNFTWGTGVGDVNNSEQAYNLNASNIPFEEIMIASYINKKSVDSFEKINTATGTYDVDGQTLGQGGISGGGTLDGKQGMIFIK